MQEGLSRFALECSICMEPFRVPATLPCGHSFCSPCLVQLPVRECPLCKKRFTLVPDVNIVLRDMVNMQYGDLMSDVVVDSTVIRDECENDQCNQAIGVEVDVEVSRRESHHAFVIVAMYMSLVSIAGGCGLLLACGAYGGKCGYIFILAGVSFGIVIPIFLWILAFCCRGDP